MAPGKKGKSNKGKEMTLSEFQGNTAPKGGEHDWAEDVWEPEEHGDGVLATGVEGGTGPDARALHERRYNHDRTKLGTETNFRDASSKVPDDMPPPYVAHLGNLKTGISKEILCEEFFPDKIKECRLITRDERSTFAFLEFVDVRTLQLVLLMNERPVLGRKVRIDVASPEQIARMTGHNKEGGLRRGGESNAGLDSLDRDAFGTGSPVSQGMGRNFGGKNNSGGAGGLVAVDAFAGFRSEPTMQQHGGGGGFGSMQDMTNWRDEGERELQPSFEYGDKQQQQGGGRRSRGSPTSSGAPGFGKRNGGSSADVTTPNSGGASEGWNFRDAQPAAQPAAPPVATEGDNVRQGFGQATQQSPVSAGGNKRFQQGGNNNKDGAPQRKEHKKATEGGPSSPTTKSAPTQKASSAEQQPASPPPPAPAAAPAEPPRSWASLAAKTPAPTAPQPQAPAKTVLRNNNNNNNTNKKPAEDSDRFAEFRK